MTHVAQSVTVTQLDVLYKHGFVDVDLKNSYELKRMSNSTSVLILYTSGKLVVQAKKDVEDEIIQLLESIGIEFLNKSTLHKKSSMPFQSKNMLSDTHLSSLHIEHIGSDETLKGDTFGGLVVCGVHLTEELLYMYGDRLVDSKLISDERISVLVKTVLKTHPQYIEIRELDPYTYNSMIAQQSITDILNSLHKDVIETLQGRFGKKQSVVDAFPGCIVGEFQVYKAEQKSKAVALASMIARYVGLQQIKRLEEEAGFPIPLGSTHVSNALFMLKEQHLSPKQFVKLHFKNVALYFKE